MGEGKNLTKFTESLTTIDHGERGKNCPKIVDISRSNGCPLYNSKVVNIRLASIS